MPHPRNCSLLCHYVFITACGVRKMTGSSTVQPPDLSVYKGVSKGESISVSSQRGSASGFSGGAGVFPPHPCTPPYNPPIL